MSVPDTVKLSALLKGKDGENGKEAEMGLMLCSDDGMSLWCDVTW